MRAICDIEDEISAVRMDLAEFLGYDCVGQPLDKDELIKNTPAAVVSDSKNAYDAAKKLAAFGGNERGRTTRHIQGQEEVGRVQLVGYHIMMCIGHGCVRVSGHVRRAWCKLCTCGEHGRRAQRLTSAAQSRGGSRPLWWFL